jgi:hypothetical protein
MDVSLGGRVAGGWVAWLLGGWLGYWVGKLEIFAIEIILVYQSCSVYMMLPAEEPGALLKRWC